VEEDRLEEIRERRLEYMQAAEFDEEREAILADLYNSYVNDVGYLLGQLSGEEQTSG
jgi:hypothetical protein